MREFPEKIMVGGYEFELSNDSMYSDELVYVWAGEVSSRFQEIAESVADIAAKAGFEVVAVDHEQQGRESSYYPVVCLSAASLPDNLPIRSPEDLSKKEMRRIIRRLWYLLFVSKLTEDGLRKKFGDELAKKIISGNYREYDVVDPDKEHFDAEAIKECLFSTGVVPNKVMSLSDVVSLSDHDRACEYYGIH